MEEILEEFSRQGAHVGLRRWYDFTRSTQRAKRHSGGKKYS